MELGLAGKSVLITGAASGIGLASAEAFAAEGARVLAVDINADVLHAAVAALGSEHPMPAGPRVGRQGKPPRRSIVPQPTGRTRQA